LQRPCQNSESRQWVRSRIRDPLWRHGVPLGDHRSLIVMVGRRLLFEIPELGVDAHLPTPPPPPGGGGSRGGAWGSLPSLSIRVGHIPPPKFSPDNFGRTRTPDNFGGDNSSVGQDPSITSLPPPRPTNSRGGDNFPVEVRMTVPLAFLWLEKRKMDYRGCHTNRYTDICIYTDIYTDVYILV